LNRDVPGEDFLSRLRILHLPPRYSAGGLSSLGIRYASARRPR
jgi:hypothetical protein